MPRKLQPPTERQYQRAVGIIARQFAPTDYPCGKCGWPVLRGYRCGTCNDWDPDTKAKDFDPYCNRKHE